MSTDNDIERILSEEPLIENKKPIKNKFKKPNLKNLFTKKRLIIGGVIILTLLILLGLLLIPSCAECNVCKECIQDISINDIKSQIISKGYVELNNGELKLAPYLG